MNEAECDALIDYVRSLPVPGTSEPTDDKVRAQRKSGSEVFKSIGCASCHTPNLGNVRGIYSDLLLHDMGTRLGDTDAYTVFVSDPPRAEAVEASDLQQAVSGTASAREWRTPPLWGVRHSGPYLHDGRAATIADAIVLHAGQGSAAARRYAELSPRRKQQLEAFLNALVAPSTDR